MIHGVANTHQTVPQDAKLFMNAADYEKLKHTEDFSLAALVKLSKLRRKVAEHGYEFLNLKEGEIILLLEAARVINCQESADLARQFLELVGICSQESAPARRQYGKQPA